jgi:hypothetical protein
MTKQEFLNGVSFRIKGFSTYKGANTYKYDIGCIAEEIRSHVDEKVIITSHHCNTTKIGTKGFEGFAFIMNKRVNVKFKFEDLVKFEAEV